MIFIINIKWIIVFYAFIFTVRSISIKTMSKRRIRIIILLLIFFLVIIIIFMHFLRMKILLGIFYLYTNFQFIISILSMNWFILFLLILVHNFLLNFMIDLIFIYFILYLFFINIVSFFTFFAWNIFTIAFSIKIFINFIYFKFVYF